LARTVTIIAASSTVAAASLIASGASLTPLIVRETVAVSVAVPSETV
jgi:hypothetical protein